MYSQSLPTIYLQICMSLKIFSYSARGFYGIIEAHKKYHILITLGGTKMFDHVFGAMWYAVLEKQALCMRNVHKEVILVLKNTYTNVT